jgi:RNA polymerase sigma-70 factor (ECF subfamily)
VTLLRQTAIDEMLIDVPGEATETVGTRPVDEVTGWALAARTGEPLAQAAFIRATQPEVWRFVAAMVDTASADDLTQETYLRAFRALPSFEGRSTARTWLYGIARRVCADHVRGLVRRRRLDASAAPEHIDFTDPASTVGAADLLARLGHDRREAFVATALLGLSYAEAAVALGVPIGTIRSRVARARADLVLALQGAPVG